MYVPTIFGWNREDVLFLFNVLCYIVCCSLRQEMSIWIRGDSEQESFTVTNHRNTTLTAHCQLPRSSQVFPGLPTTLDGQLRNQSCEFVAAHGQEVSRPEHSCATSIYDPLKGSKLLGNPSEPKPVGHQKHTWKCTAWYDIITILYITQTATRIQAKMLKKQISRHGCGSNVHGAMAVYGHPSWIVGMRNPDTSQIVKRNNFEENFA